MIDLDYFKLYNDRNGHLGGDDCLRRVAKALSESTDRRRDLMARYGGEEFAAILTETDLHGAATVGERMRAAVRSLGIPHADSPTAPEVTVSVGCAALTPTKGSAPQDLIAAADRALYRAKEMGRNRVMRDDQFE
jgi:diguanylate cyclase (GGDEF)-like protein